MSKQDNYPTDGSSSSLSQRIEFVEGVLADHECEAMHEGCDHLYTRISHTGQCQCVYGCPGGGFIIVPCH